MPARVGSRTLGDGPGQPAHGPVVLESVPGSHCSVRVEKREGPNVASPVRVGVRGAGAKLAIGALTAARISVRQAHNAPCAE